MFAVRYLSGVPERFLEKFQTYYLGLFLKIARSKRDLGSHTQAELVDLGRRMGSLQLVIFSLALAHVSSDIISPYGPIQAAVIASRSRRGIRRTEV